MTLMIPAFVGTPEVNRVYNVDALTLLRAMPDKSVDFIFTDPPYGHNNNNGDLIQNREAALGQTPTAGSNPRPIANDGIEANELFQACLPEYRRILVPGGCCCCCCCGGGGPDPQFARWSLWMDEHLEFKQMVVWDKGKIGMGWHYRRSYETVLVGMRPGAACKWYDESDAVENIIRPGSGIRKIIPMADQHPTEKPVSLAAHFIKLHTRPGEIVLDPFCGGGSTLVAAKILGRAFIGGELDTGFINMARRKVGVAFEAPPLDDLPMFAEMLVS